MTIDPKTLGPRRRDNYTVVSQDFLQLAPTQSYNAYWFVTELKRSSERELNVPNPVGPPLPKVLPINTKTFKIYIHVENAVLPVPGPDIKTKVQIFDRDYAGAFLNQEYLTLEIDSDTTPVIFTYTANTYSCRMFIENQNPIDNIVLSVKVVAGFDEDTRWP